MASFIPEYTITSHILKNISGIEYSKAIVETTAILPNWQNQLIIEAKARTIAFSLQRFGLNIHVDNVKKRLNRMPAQLPKEVDKYIEALAKVEEFAKIRDFEEDEVKVIEEIFTGKKSYRTSYIAGTVHPEEILAEMTKLLDWNNSLDARETHPVITSALLKAQLEYINPFDKTTSLISDIITILSLKTGNYHILSYYSLEEYYFHTQRDYQNILKDAFENDDFTRWLEYFTEGFNREITNIAENVKIMARDTKLVKAAPNMRLTERQQRVVTYLQDYGMLQNKDFSAIFPDISEDTVLRELKALMKKGVVVKRGSTKSSRYELA